MYLQDALNFFYGLTAVLVIAGILLALAGVWDRIRGRG